MDFLLQVLNSNSSPEYVNAQDNEGNTALMCALISEQFDKAMVVLNTGVCDTNLVNNRGENCAHIAALHGNLDMLMILAPTTNLLATTNTSSSVMHYAVVKCINWDMIEWLLKEVPGLPENSYNTIGLNVMKMIKDQNNKVIYIELVKDIRNRVLSLHY